MSEIIIYTTQDNSTAIEVRFEGETVWLSLNQIAEIFERDKSVISRHLKNIYYEGELDYHTTVAKNATVQTEGNRKIERVIEYYNLDAILSVGYRVNSKRGTQFRQWATKRLNEFLVKGYSLNQQRLEQLKRIVNVIEQSGTTAHIELNEAKGLIELLSKYTRSFILLNQYDSNSLSIDNLNKNITHAIKYRDAKEAIEQLKNQLIAKKEATSLFGNEKDKSFEGILQSVVQTFDGNYLYASIEEQAAHLLYFIIKSHPFTDGNKRIGAFLFVWFLEKKQTLAQAIGRSKNK